MGGEQKTVNKPIGFIGAGQVRSCLVQSNDGAC
jgi:hypothetical protein